MKDTTHATPLDTIGMGNPCIPYCAGYNKRSGSGIGNTGADFHSTDYWYGAYPRQLFKNKKP